MWEWRLRRVNPNTAVRVRKTVDQTDPLLRQALVSYVPWEVTQFTFLARRYCRLVTRVHLLT